MVKMQCINFHQLSVRLEELPLTLDDFPYGRETSSQLSSTFHTAKRPSVNIPCGRETIHQLLLTFCMAGRLSVTSVNFLCAQETFRKLPSTFCAAWRLLSTSVNYPCQWETFRQLSPSPVQPGGFPLTSVDFACCRETLRQLQSTFTATERTSFNFRELYMWPGDILSTFCAGVRPSIKSRQLLSTSVNF